MDIPRVVIIGTEFQSSSRNDVRNRRIMTDLVVLDQTDGQVVKPLVYHLREEISEVLEQDPGVSDAMLHREAEPFLLMGEIVHVDREKKLITLTNNNQISYKYLIVASGASSHQIADGHVDAFSPGVTALVDALKMRRDGLRPSGPLPSTTPHEPVHGTEQQSGPQQEALLEVLQQVATEIRSEHSSGRFSGRRRRLFEVQL